MTLKVYNSLTNEKEEFKPLEEKTVKMYVCGQTVYDYMHVGHARTYVAFDIVRRYLEFLGYSVETVINITDVNKKINDRAREEDESPWNIAKRFAEINLEDFDDLGIEADAYPKASDYISEMIDLVGKLMSKDLAYEAEGDVFFDVRKFGKYGELSNQDLEDIRPERTDEITSSEKKKNPEDFALWKSQEESEFSPTWKSPWGEGVPGWHIECSTMSLSLLGEQFDIHGGGSDLVFPHHENEIAQTEGATGKKWVNYWMHSGLVQMGEEKMSKSQQNFVSVRELLEEHDPQALRLMIAETHYRNPMKYSDEKIEKAEKTLKSLKNAVRNLKAEINSFEESIPSKMREKDIEFLEQVFNLKKEFLEAMDDDFNTPKALRNLHELSKLAHSYLEENPKRPVLSRALTTILDLGGILGILEEKEKRQLKRGSLMENLMEEILKLRERYRKKGEYEAADSIRNALEEARITIEDTERGPRWKSAE
ncbi:hypothetical protein AKJ57_05195 [candidate division MSBL1 archaeon SCGC-AAA259A05]|uniref:Cysteine--tRNA ligase n=1 Tax=candidate division MSBL1 archaeon SCGC-AAA259A05 TaxID=1698259 RepID=A0A133U5R1_9EURY|nr:hypothetical protein AKJ57_05195 [candidate division MSBL1 archaeon SCGC-AAA259A05]